LKTNTTFSREDQLPLIKAKLSGLPPEELLNEASRIFAGKVVLASSLGLEDQVLTAMIAFQHLPIPVFTLDTGRLFAETLDLIERTELRLGVRIQLFCPQAGAVQEMVSKHGINLFRKSVDLRKYCCAIRKLEPLKRALAGHAAWICGLRQQQGGTRHQVESVEWDPAWNLVKLNPLAGWGETEVRQYLEKHQVPFNPLHNQGYPSIGCACCTRAILPGEEPRAGRWWWERVEHRECGLHPRPAALALPKKAL
jgi:phosphoadenosine phosphosulfate reductase